MNPECRTLIVCRAQLAAGVLTVGPQEIADNLLEKKLISKEVYGDILQNSESPEDKSKYLIGAVIDKVRANPGVQLRKFKAILSRNRRTDLVQLIEDKFGAKLPADWDEAEYIRILPSSPSLSSHSSNSLSTTATTITTTTTTTIATAASPSSSTSSLSTSPASSARAPASPPVATRTKPRVATPTKPPVATPTKSPVAKKSKPPVATPTKSPRHGSHETTQMPTNSIETTPTHPPDATPSNPPEAMPIDPPKVTPTDPPEATPIDPPKVTLIDPPEATPIDHLEVIPTTPEVEPSSPVATPSISPVAIPTRDSPEDSVSTNSSEEQSPALHGEDFFKWLRQKGIGAKDLQFLRDVDLHVCVYGLYQQDDALCKHLSRGTMAILKYSNVKAELLRRFGEHMCKTKPDMVVSPKRQVNSLEDSHEDEDSNGSGQPSSELTDSDLSEVFAAVKNACGKWYEIGLELRVGEAALIDIEETIKPLQGRLRETLRIWLLNGGETRTWLFLVDTMKSRLVCRPDIGDKIMYNH